MLSRDNAYTRVGYIRENSEYVVTTQLIVFRKERVKSVEEIHDIVEVNVKYLLQQVYGDILSELYILSMYMFEDKVKLDSRVQDKVSELIKLCQHAVG